MFGDLDVDGVDISEVETETTKSFQKEAEAAETASVIAETGATPKDKSICHLSPHSPWVWDTSR